MLKEQFHNGEIEEKARHAARTLSKAQRAIIAGYFEYLRLMELEAMVKHPDPVRMHQGQGYCKALDTAIETIRSEQGLDISTERQSRRREGLI